MHRWLVFMAALLAVSGLSVTGCGDSANFDVAPVSGQVTMDGKPLPKAIVTFMPTEGGADRPASVGATDSQGRFTLRTSTGHMGAIPGMHKVMIVAASEVPEGQSLPDDYSQWREVENPIPTKYSGTDTDLSYTVPPEGSNAANFEIQGDAK